MGGSRREETGWAEGFNGQPWGELPAKGNRFPFPLSQTCQALNERFLFAIPENIQTWTEIIIANELEVEASVPDD